MDGADLTHGLKGIGLSIAGLLAANVAAYIAGKIWDFYQKRKGPTGEEFKKLITALEETNKIISTHGFDLKKIVSDQRRIYLFLKVIAGDQWPNYFKKVREIETENKLTEGDL